MSITLPVRRNTCRNFYFAVSTKSTVRIKIFFLLALSFQVLGQSHQATAQASATLVPDTLLTAFSTNALKKLSLEELMNVEVMSVSKHPEKLKDAASAIQ